MNQRKAGAILSYIFTITNAIVGFIYIPLIIYYLGKDEYGLYQLMGSVLVYLGLFDFGLGKTVTRYYSKYIALNDDKKKENLLGISTIIFSILSIILLLFGSVFYFYLDNVFGKSLSDTELATAKKMYIVILITAIFTILTSAFKSVITAHEKFVLLKSIDIIQVVIRPIITIAVFAIQANALNLVIIQAVINITAIITMIIYSFKKLDLKIKLHSWDPALFKSLMKFSFFIFLTAIMDQIFWRSGQVILGIFVGTGSVAIYSIASQFIMYYMTLSTAMSGVFLPNITKQVTQKVSNEKLTDTFIRIGRIQYILLGLILSGFILIGKDFIILWVGEEYSSAYLMTLLIMIPFTIDLIQNIGLAILQAKNMYAFRAIVFLSMAIINVIISIPLAIKYQGIGVALATGICFLIGNGLIMNVFYHKKVQIDIVRFWKEIFRLSVPMILVLSFWYIIISKIGNLSLVLFITIGISYSIFYLYVMWKFAMNDYEKSLFIKPLNKIKKTA